jgi:hypothetical protein
MHTNTVLFGTIEQEKPVASVDHSINGITQEYWR